MIILYLHYEFCSSSEKLFWAVHLVALNALQRTFCSTSTPEITMTLFQLIHARTTINVNLNEGIIQCTELTDAQIYSFVQVKEFIV